MIKKLLITTSLLSLGFSYLFAQAPAMQQAPALPVQVFEIVDGEHFTTKTYPTILKSIEKVNVIARVKGILQEKYFNEGDFVKKGTLLYKIEQDTYLANLNMKKAEYTKAKKDYDRAKSLITSKSISEQSFDDYTYQYETSKAALDQAQIEFNYTKVVSPIDGIVGIKKNDLGDLVGSDASNSILITVTNTNPIHAEFSLPKDDMNNYLEQIRKSNMKADIENIKVSLIVNNKTYENGKIDFISPDIDTTTDTLLLRAKFDNKDNELVVGNFSTIQLSNIALGKVNVIPENALSRTAQGAFVYVIDENMTAKVRPVEIGVLIKEGVIIKSGLKVGDKVVVSNLAKLRPDTKVQILNKEK
jgi:membrane fusion protein (multidrug efflux system)